MSDETLWQKFHVGQRVWCVDSASHPEWMPIGIRTHGICGLKAGEIYTISELTLGIKGQPAVHIKELPRLCCKSAKKPPYDLRRFEPVREQNIDLFRQMCRDAETKVSA